MGYKLQSVSHLSLSHSITMLSRSALVGSAMLALAAAEDAPLLATALEVVSRASTSSEVLSLNLTNLIILIALKIAIVVFGLVSGGGVTGRSDDQPTSVSPTSSRPSPSTPGTPTSWRPSTTPPNTPRTEES